MAILAMKKHGREARAKSGNVTRLEMLSTSAHKVWYTGALPRESDAPLTRKGVRSPLRFVCTDDRLTLDLVSQPLAASDCVADERELIIVIQAFVK